MITNVLITLLIWFINLIFLPLSILTYVLPDGLIDSFDFILLNIGKTNQFFPITEFFSLITAIFLIETHLLTFKGIRLIMKVVRGG